MHGTSTCAYTTIEIFSVVTDWDFGTFSCREYEDTAGLPTSSTRFEIRRGQVSWGFGGRDLDPGTSSVWRHQVRAEDLDGVRSLPKSNAQSFLHPRRRHWQWKPQGRPQIPPQPHRDPSCQVSLRHTLSTRAGHLKSILLGMEVVIGLCHRTRIHLVSCL